MLFQISVLTFRLTHFCSQSNSTSTFIRSIKDDIKFVKLLKLRESEKNIEIMVGTTKSNISEWFFWLTSAELNEGVD